MTKSKFETEKEKWIKRGEIKTYNMTELLTYDEKQTEDHLSGAEVHAYAAYTSIRCKRFGISYQTETREMLFEKIINCCLHFEELN